MNETQAQTKPLFSRGDLFRLIWPLLTDQLLTVLIGMVDVLMVASVGEAAVSGVSLVDSINNLIIQVLFAITAGGTVIIARFIGAKDKEHASKATAQLLTLTIFGTVMIMLFMLVFRHGVLGLLFGTVEADVMSNANVYLIFTVLSFPALALYHASAAGFRATGETKVPLYCSFAMNAFNIAGNAFCIFILGMGVEGVAIPTLIARVLGGIGLYYVLQNKNSKVHISQVSDFIPNKSIMKEILSIGIPNGVESSIFQCGKITLQSLVASLGTSAIAGFAVASNLVTYLYLPGNALGAAMLTVVGQCYGAGEKKQAKHYAKLLVGINYALLAVICMVMLVGNHFFVGMYHLSGLSAEYAQGLLLSHTIAMILWPLGFLVAYYFRAIGKATFTMIVAITVMWIFRVGFAYIFIKLFHMNVLGIWYAMYVDWAVRVVIFLIAFKKSET